jgi:Na+/H+-dicarboxylate symporter
MSILTLLKERLTGLTFFTLGCGLLLGFALQSVRPLRTVLNEDEFLREVERGSQMKVIVRSAALTDMVKTRPALLKGLEAGATLALPSADIIVPDPDAEAALGCARQGDTYFVGEVGRRSEAYLPPRLGPDSQETSSGSRDVSLVGAIGSVYVCGTDGRERRRLVARGLPITIIVHDRGRSSCRFQTASSLATYSDFLGDMFITFLLMLFIPTLALALVRAVLEAAGAEREYRGAFCFFVLSSMVAAAIGTLGGLAAAWLRGDVSRQNLQDLAESFGGTADPPHFDPHPLLTQLGHVIPSNPVSALSDPNGNSGLQVAFLAVVIGMILASFGSELRRRISRSLQSVLSIFVRDRELGSRALSDYAEWLGPAGVFFLAVSGGLKMDLTAIQDLGWLMGTVLIGLTAFSIICLLWVRFSRNWQEWLHAAMVPSARGLITAFATSSSYSAIPEINAIPMASIPMKRGVLDFGITLNKSGTALYIGAAAGFLLVRFGSVNPLAVFLTVVLCGIGSTACAGLPFAAVFALRMVLATSNIPFGLAWLILPIDPIIDRFVTVVNVFGNVCACSNPKRQVMASAVGAELGRQAAA